jgi:L-lactate dehydrogenase (cytochrome)
MKTLNLVPANTDDYRRLAARKLPQFLFDYLDGGSYQEYTLANNVSDFTRILLNQRVLCDVSNITTDAQLVGDHYGMPLALAPVGMGGMYAQRGECQAKRAADAHNLPFTLSTVSICSLEEVAAVSDKPFWFQLYMLKDRGPVKELLQRARAVGVKTLVFTVDLAVLGARYRDVRNGFSGGATRWGAFRGTTVEYLRHPGWTLDVGVRGKPHTFGNLAEYVPNATRPDDFQGWITQQVDPSVTWRDIAWLRDQWPGKLLIKGILTPEDAHRAKDVHADGIVVSNHGGRQLDSVPSTIQALPAIADSVGDAMEILLDGGVRSGMDILKARALGAQGVLIGRPWVYALAARGEPGLDHLLHTFQRELRVAMALTGQTHMASVDQTVLAPNP